MNRVTIKKGLAVLIGSIGFLIIPSTAGASDLNLIKSNMEAVLWVTNGLLMMGIAELLYEIAQTEEWIRKVKRRQKRKSA